MSGIIPPQSIPIEILRSVIAIAEERTFSKAAVRLGISQPAVSSQIKRLQQIVGGDIFDRSVGGSIPTILGETVIMLARKALEAHDQIFRLGATDLGPEQIRLGISSLLVREFLHSQTSTSTLANVFVQSDSSYILGRSIIDGRLDIACCFAMEKFAADLRPFIVAEREDQLVWVRARHFVLSPGQPVPIVTWHGDEWMTQALSQQGLSYQIVFDGEDYEAKRSVVEAGLGLIALPSRLIPATLIRAKEYYLPELPTIKAALYVRGKQQSQKLIALKNQLCDLFFADDVGLSGKQERRER